MKKAMTSILITGIILLSMIFQSSGHSFSKSGDQFPQPNGINLQKADTSHWRQLFNGKDLTGWKHVGPGSQYVEDGLIKSHGGMGLLYWTGEKFGNCTIRVVFRMRDTNSNSGVFIRIPI